MKATKYRRRGGGGGLRIKKGRGFMCGCGGSKAVSISDGSDKQSPMAGRRPRTRRLPLPACPRSPPPQRRQEGQGAGRRRSLPPRRPPHSLLPPRTTPTSASRALPCARSLQGAVVEGGGGRRHRRTASEGGGARRVEESVAVVQESADPLADFRRSMLQMMVEKEIVGGAELRELLHRFLSLNSPHHHHLILRAFAEIWEEVFSGYERTPDFLVSHGKRKANHTAAADKWVI